MTHLFHEVMGNISGWMKPYISDIAIAQVSTLLVIYGDNLNSMIRNSLAGFHVAIRFAIYVLICAFGYGALTIAASETLEKFLTSLGPNIFPLVALGGFILIAYLAQRVKHI
jgi:hypothetical protein